jgi:hypothetical protein
LYHCAFFFLGLYWIGIDLIDLIGGENTVFTAALLCSFMYYPVVGW